MSDSTIIKYDVLSSELKNGELRVQLGDRSLNEGAVGDASVWGLAGFYSIPNDPDANGACMGLFATEGNNRRVIATKDNRLNEKYGDAAPGDSGIVTIRDARLIVKESNDSVTIMTKNHSDGDALMVVQLSGDGGEFVVLVGGQSESAMIKVKKDRIALSAGGSCIMIDSDGITINGSYFACNTGGGNLGTIGPLTPIKTVNSVLYGPMGQTGAPATNWVVSPA